MKRLPYILLLSIAASIPGCADEDSYLLIATYADSDSIEEVAQLRVHAENAGKQDILFYPKEATGKFRLDTTTPITFSISFAESYQGLATVEVEALGKTGESLGYGRAQKALVAGKTERLEVRVFPEAVRIKSSQGAGPVSCSPTQPAAACGPGMTCSLMSCQANETPMGLCYPAGNGIPGTACTKNSDCLVGSQCFSFQKNCPVRTCLRYCETDRDCTEAESRCDTPLPCGARLCSRPCNPTGAARTGCTNGLVCFIYAGESTDCACESSRAGGGVGASCTTDHQCGPGTLCVLPQGTSQGTCQPVCLRAQPTCPTGLTCSALGGYTKFGACL